MAKSDGRRNMSAFIVRSAIGHACEHVGSSSPSILRRFICKRKTDYSAHAPEPVVVLLRAGRRRERDHEQARCDKRNTEPPLHANRLVQYDVCRNDDQDELQSEDRLRQVQ